MKRETNSEIELKNKKVETIKPVLTAEEIEEKLTETIKEDIQKIDDKINSIEEIPEYQKERIEKLGGETSQLQEKIHRSLNPLKSIREKIGGRFAKIAGMIGLVGTLNTDIANYADKIEFANERKEETEYNDKKLTEFFIKTGADSLQSVHLVKDLHKMFSNDEMLFQVTEILDINNTDQVLPNFDFLVNPENRKKIINLSQEFEISADYILRYLCQNKDIQNVIASSDFKDTILPHIREIKKLFPQTVDRPSVEFIDFTNQFKNVSNPEYHKALQFLLNKHFSPRISDFSGLPDDIIKLSEEKYRPLLNELDQHGIWFDQTLLYIEIDEKSGEESIEKKLIRALDNPDNKDILPLFNKTSPLGNREAFILIGEKEYARTLRSYLLNPEYRNFIKDLDDIFPLKNFLDLETETITKILTNKDYQKALRILLENTSVNFHERGNTASSIDQILSYYTLGDAVDIKKLSLDLEVWQKGEHISLEYFYEKLHDEKMVSFARLATNDHSVDANVAKFESDPAFYIINTLHLLTKTPIYLQQFSSKEQKEWILRVARNMDVSGIEISEKNFEKVFKKTAELRANQELLNQSLFKGRNVALFAHNETYDGNKERFGGNQLRLSLKEQQPAGFEVFKASLNTPEDLQSEKRAFLNYVSGHNNLTVLVDAHGGPDAIYFTNGIPNKQGLIEKTNSFESVSVHELASTLEERFDNGYHDQPIIILTSCFNQDFIRSLYSNISYINEARQKSIPLPIMCGESEYGQYGFSSLGTKYESKFLEALLDNKKNTKIKDVIDLEEHAKEKGILSNPSLFIPLQENTVNPETKDKKKQTYFQIAETIDKTKKQISHMENFAQSVQNDLINNQTASYFEEVQPKNAKAIREAIKKGKEKKKEMNSDISTA